MSRHLTVFAVFALTLSALFITEASQACESVPALHQIAFEAQTVQGQTRHEDQSFVLGRVSDTSPWVAYVSQGNQCVVECTMRDSRSEAFGPDSIEFTCRNSALKAMTAPVTLFIGRGTVASAQLQFGTWLDGFQRIPLQVKIDHLLDRTPALIALRQ